MKVGNIGSIPTGGLVDGLLYSGGADGARSLLSAIAGSIISVAALASSIAITALALASGQFGSRLLRNFMDDRGFQITLGTFNGTFFVLFGNFALDAQRRRRRRRRWRAANFGDDGAGFGGRVRVSADLFPASHGARDSGALRRGRRRARFERRNRAALRQKRGEKSRRLARPHSRNRGRRCARLGRRFQHHRHRQRLHQSRQLRPFAAPRHQTRMHV